MAGSQTPKRAEWGTLSREVIVGAALDVLQVDGLGALSIRTVAARLDVSPMALYRHVSSKDDLLDDVVDLLFAERWRPTVAEGRWRAWVIEVADRLRRFLVEEPAALRVYLRHPVVSATAADRMDACLAVLRRALSDEARARRAYAAIQTYTIGFAALEAARESTRPAGARSVGASEPHPDLAESERVAELASYASPTQFRVGLDYLLNGIIAEA